MALTFWVATFRAPADNYEHLHVSKVNSDGPSKVYAAQVLKANTNLDIQIETLKQYPNISTCQDALMDATAKAIAQGGPEYRSLQGSEQFLTARKAKKLLTENEMDSSNIKIPDGELSVPQKVAEAQGEILTNPPEIITP